VIRRRAQHPVASAVKERAGKRKSRAVPSMTYQLNRIRSLLALLASNGELHAIANYELLWTNVGVEFVLT
jgi:hypothetical protein